MNFPFCETLDCLPPRQVEVSSGGCFPWNPFAYPFLWGAEQKHHFGAAARTGFRCIEGKTVIVRTVGISFGDTEMLGPGLKYIFTKTCCHNNC